MHAPSWTSSTRHRSRSSNLYLLIGLQTSAGPSVLPMRAWLLSTFLPAAAWALSCTCIRRAATFCSLSLCSIDLTKGVSNCSSRSYRSSTRLGSLGSECASDGFCILVPAYLPLPLRHHQCCRGRTRFLTHLGLSLRHHQCCQDKLRYPILRWLCHPCLEGRLAQSAYLF